MNDTANIKGSRVFLRNWESTKRIVLNRGGTRSGKTYSLAQIAVTWLLTGQYGKSRKCEKGVFSVVRKTLPALKATVLRDIEEIMHGLNVFHKFEHSKVDRWYKYEGRMLEYFSADDQQKVRGRKRNILYCNEANELNYKQEFYQMLLRTTDAVFLDFNPDDENSWLNKEMEQARAESKGDVDLIISTYKDNPFLQPETINEIEYLCETDPQFWKIYGLGQYGRITGLIFPRVQTVTEWPVDPEAEFYGLDFGFTNDPTALCCIAVKGKDLYFKECIYQTGLTNSDISEEMTAQGISKRAKIYADQAEPKSIEELRRRGWKVTGAKKGKDSIKHGIGLIKQYNINILSSSLNFLKEQRSYKWKVDKHGDPTNAPLDAFNHLWDAARYGCIMSLKSKGRTKKFSSFKYSK